MRVQVYIGNNQGRRRAGYWNYTNYVIKGMFSIFSVDGRDLQKPIALVNANI